MTMDFVEGSASRNSIQLERRESEFSFMLNSGDVVFPPVETTRAWKFSCSEVPSGKLTVSEWLV